MSNKPNKLRILLYSHDTVGLGHLRRNQAIAYGLARSLGEPAILMASGARQCTLFDIPRCVDFVTIPSVRKSSNGDYKARNSGLSIGDAMNVRTEILRSLIQSFRPDVFVADKVPLGVHGELEPALRVLREQSYVRCVLGLRDILDEPVSARRDWATHGYERAIRAYYDEVWVYGDQRVYDVANEYCLSPHVAEKITYVGYLDRSAPLNGCCSLRDTSTDELRHLSGRIALCMVGGGEDGAHVASTFAQSKLPSDMSGVVLTGPFMPASLREHLHSISSTNRQLWVLDFMKRPEWLISRAERIVAMGGYNTVCEILSYEKAGLIIPRVSPREEQLVRAKRLRDMGLVDMMHPRELNCKSLAHWLHKEIQAPSRVRERINLAGLERLPQLLANLVNLNPSGIHDRHDKSPPAPWCLEPVAARTEAQL